MLRGAGVRVLKVRRVLRGVVVLGGPQMEGRVVVTDVGREVRCREVLA